MDNVFTHFYEKHGRCSAIKAAGLMLEVIQWRPFYGAGDNEVHTCCVLKT